MVRMFMVLFIFLFSGFVSSNGAVAEQDFSTQGQAVVENHGQEKESLIPENRELLPQKSIRERVSSVDPGAITKRVEEAGDSLYEVLQSGSPLYFVIVLGLSFLFMLLGLFIKTLMKIGIGCLLLAFVSLGMIQFAPEIVGTLLKGVRNIFYG